MVPVVFLLNGFVKGDFKQAFLFAIAVAVGLTPEMLPMVVTANLARDAVAMSRHKVIVKRLNAIQNLGAMDVLCTDQTGTLTQDKVVLEKHLNLSGTSDLRVLELASLNSYYQTGLKNLDRAVLEHVELAHEFDVLQHYTKVDEIPFDFTRRRMSVVRLSIEPARPYVPAIFAATMNQWRFTGLADDACPMGAAFRTARRKVVGWIFPMCSHESHRMNIRAGSDHDVPLTQVCMLPHFGQPGSRATQAELTNGVPFVTAKIPLGSSLSRFCMPNCGARDYGTVNKSKRNQLEHAR